MAALQLSAYFLSDINGAVHEGGSLSSPFAVTISGAILDETYSLSNGSSAVVWQASSGPPGDFNLLWLQSDQNVDVELTTDVGGDVGKEVYTIQIKGSGAAGEFGPPIVLPSNVSFANYTENFAGGTADVIDRVRVKNSSGSTANVRVVVIT